MSDQHELEAALNFGAPAVDGRHTSAVPLVSAVLFFQAGQPPIGGPRRLATADRRAVAAGPAGILAEALRTGEPAVSDNPALYPELAQLPGFRACHSVMALPLRAGFEIYGVAVYGHPRPGFFDAGRQAKLAARVNHALIGLHIDQLSRSLRQAKEQAIDAHEDTQTELARDLHDGPAQDVLLLAMRANFARHLLKRDVAAAGEQLFKLEELARKTNKELRHLLFTLRPLSLENQGLSAALQALAEKMKETYGQTVIVEADPGLDDRAAAAGGTLFYIVEEAVTNARKHARANHIWVRLKAHADGLVVEVQDDGAGFDVAAVQGSYDQRGSLGLVNMRERAEMIDGALSLESAEGGGTRVRVTVPLTRAGPIQAGPMPAKNGRPAGMMRAAELEPNLPGIVARLAAHALTAPPPAAHSIDTRPRPALPQPVEPPAARRSRRLPAGLRWAGASVLMAAVLLAGAGTAAASRQSVPGDWLYGVKRADESVQVLLSPPSARAFVYTGLARQRLMELRVLEQRGSRDALVVNSLAADLVTETAAALDLVDSMPAEGQADVLSTLVNVTGDEQNTLAALMASAPAGAQTGLDRALQAASQHHAHSVVRLEQVLASHAEPVSSPTPASPSPTATATSTPASPTETRPAPTEAPRDPTHIPPGQTRVPPGQTHVPPGQTHVPPGQTHEPPGQTDVPPEQTHVPPGQTHVPPGQTHVPPGQTHVPPGQTHVPPGQTQVPPGQTNLPPEETHGPPERTDVPPKNTHEPHGGFVRTVDERR